jgi:hypothetical protein
MSSKFSPQTIEHTPLVEGVGAGDAPDLNITSLSLLVMFF